MSSVTMQLRNLSIALLLLLTAAAPSFAQKKLKDKVAAVVKAFHAEGSFNGNVLVARKNEVVSSESVGMANVEKAVSNESKTRFRIASITKGFTGVLALQAVERGELDLKKSIRDYLPGLTNEALSAITVEHLLTHKSGIADFIPTPSESDQSVLETLLAGLNGAKVVAAPGEKYQYCNVGYTTLGFVLEHATSKSLKTLLQERVFEPFKMSDSYLDESHIVAAPTRAQGYALLDGKLSLDELENISQFSAAGGIVSTTADLLRFSNALGSDKLLSEPSRSKLLADNSGKIYFGCKNLTIPTGDRIQIFEGGMPGCSTLLVRVNDGEYTVILLANLSKVPKQKLMQTLLMAILK